MRGWGRGVFSLFVAAVWLAAPVTALAETRVRILTANTTTGDNQSYDPGHGIRIFQGLKPDVALIQEWNFGDNSPGAIARFVETAFGKGFHWFRESEAHDQIPNGIVSRWPILEKGELNDPTTPNRDFVWAKIDLPGPKKLWAFSVHFNHGDKAKRDREAEVLVDFIKRRVPKSDYLVIGGDLNTKKRGERAVEILKQIVSDRRVPVDSAGVAETNGGRKYPYDLLLPNLALEAHHTCVDIVGSAGAMSAARYPNGLVFDSRTFPHLSLVPPVRAGDSGAPGMQHMAVVKDFVIP